MKFEYQAIDNEGSIVRGIVKAKNAETVLKILLHKQLHPLDIRPLTETTVEIDRLNNLKKKLETIKQGKIADKKENIIKPSYCTPKLPTITIINKINWDYVLFIIVIVGIILIDYFK